MHPNPLHLKCECAVSVDVDGQSLEDVGKAYLQLVPRDRLTITVPMKGTPLLLPMKLAHDWDGRLRLVDRNVDLDMWCLGGDPETGDLVFVPRRSGVDVTEPTTDIAYAVAHLFNFPAFHGANDYRLITRRPPQLGLRLCGQAVLCANGWRITICEIANADVLLKALHLSGGYVVTHVVRVEREDASVFSSSQLNDLLSCLHYYLTFVLGRWAGLALPVGFNKGGHRVFERWGAPMMSLGRWQGSASWFDQHHGHLLSEVCSGFFSRWRDTVWGKAFRDALYWYAAACERGTGFGIDTGLILAQTALERLAWTYWTQGMGGMSRGKFKDRTASENIQSLLKALGIPVDIPAGLSSLKSMHRATTKTGPEATAKMRNDIVHGDPKAHFSHDGCFEALKLALWYCDMILLRLCDHKGQYASRLNHARWVGIVEQVPWA